MPRQHDPFANNEQPAPEVGTTTFAETNPSHDPQQSGSAATTWAQPDLRDATAHRAAADDVPQEWQVGDRILDLYDVTAILGQGGMGTVYKVHHRGWNTDLAVKSPQPQIFARAGGKENFIREAETWVNLGLHPHIVSCYYVRTLGGIPRVFAEYVAGGSLADWISTRRLYEGGHEQALERILDIAIQFAWGLHYAHEQGLVHQDVKPANAMMTLDGTAKVTDFGLAKAWAMAGEVGVLGAGQSILVSSRSGTPAYCSPEQYAGRVLSRRTDIWSWGVSVLEMFVGEATWLGPAVGEVLENYLEMGKEDSVSPATPAGLVALLRRCFQWRSDDRPTSMSEVTAELQEIYQYEVGQPYPRQSPKSAELRADSLNNRALSLYDLGKVEEAKQVWEQALQVDPQHLETTYNRGVVLWRQGELTDDMLVQQLEGVRAAHGDPWQAMYLRALVHVERGDVDAALLLLREAAQQAPGKTEVQALLKRVQGGNIATGQCLRVFEGQTGAVQSVSLSADGSLALSGNYDHTMQLWEVATGRCLRPFTGHTGPVHSVSLSADGRFVLSGSDDKTLRLWEVASGRCLRTFTGHTDGVWSVSLSGDGRFALSGSLDKTLRLWEVATGQCLRTFQGHTWWVNSVSLSADGRLALSGSEDNTLRLWEVASGRCLRTFAGHTGPVSLSGDGRFALSGSLDKTLRLWEVASGRCLRTFTGHTDRVNSVSLSADGSLALSGSGTLLGGDDTVRLWEVASGRCLRTFTGHTDTVSSVSLSADGRLALSGGGYSDHTVRLWELPHERFFCPVRLSQVWSHADVLHAETQAAAWLQQAENALGEARVATALGLVRQVQALPGWERSPKRLEVWARLLLHCPKVSLHAGWLAGTFTEHTEQVSSVSLSADGRLALSGSEDKTLRLWEVASGRCLRTFTGHQGEVGSVSLSVDGRFAFSGSRDTTVRLWEVASGRCLRVFAEHTVWSVSLSADGRLALSGHGTVAGGDHTVRLWEVASGRCLCTFTGHTFPVTSVCLSADGRLALSGSWDHTVRLWEVASGRCLHTLQGHASMVTSVCLSADGRLALSGSRDTTVRLWEVASGRCLRTFTGHTDWVASVRLSADGSLATSGSADRTVRLWKLDWELEARESTDWDEGARSFLELFLTQHTSYAGVLPQDREPSEQEIQQALTRHGRPAWSEQDFQDLICQLQYAGYGWLRPEGVRRKLEEMAASWQGPPLLADTQQVRKASLWSRLFRSR